METVVSAISVVIGDFEIGDRVYYNPLKGKSVAKDSVLSIYEIPIYGTVLSITERSVEVKMDDEMHARFVNIEAFNRGGRYGRCFDESKLKEKALLSCHNGKERIYATVVDYEPEVSVSLYFHAVEKTVKVPAEAYHPLGYQLAVYELED